jgi:hypothetical protein
MSNFQVQDAALFVHDLTTNEPNFRAFGALNYKDR